MNKYLIYPLLIVYLMIGVWITHTQEINIEPPSDLNGLDADLWEAVIKLSNSEDCSLPCWWGFELEETTIEKVIDFLESNQLNRSQQRSIYPDLSQEMFIQYEGYSLDFIDNSEDNRNFNEMGYSFNFTDEGVLNSLNITFRFFDAWLTDEGNPFGISRILNQFEQDPYIFTNVSPNLYADELPLWLLYPEQNLKLWYEVRYTYPSVCIDVNHLQWVGVEISADESIEEFESSEYMVPINEKWRFEHITTEEFVAFFRDYPDDCLDITDYPKEEK